MAVWQNREGGPFYFKFEYAGQRYNGKCETTIKAKAHEVEQHKRKLAKQGKLRPSAARAHARQLVRMTLDEICIRFLDMYEDQWSPSYARDMAMAIGFMVDHFGANARMSQITKAQVLDHIAKGKQRKTRKRVDGKSALVPVSNSYVNRTFVQPTRRVWKFAAEDLDIEVKMPNWRRLILPEPKTREVRVTAEQEQGLLGALDSDMRAMALFALVTGLRRQNTVDLRWSEIDWDRREIRVIGKGRYATGRKEITVYITEAIELILRAQEGNHDEFVFTYICEHSDKRRGQVGGERYPMSTTVLRERWNRARKQVPGMERFRWHDLRHVFGTRSARLRGKDMTQLLMHHEDAVTTARYVHTEEDDIRAAMEVVTQPYISTIKEGLGQEPEA